MVNDIRAKVLKKKSLIQILTQVAILANHNPQIVVLSQNLS